MLQSLVKSGKMVSESEEKVMKRRKLRGWVKIALVVIAMLSLLVINGKMTDDAVNTCIENGQYSSVCENLRK